MTARPRLLLAVLVLACLTLTALDAGERAPFAPLRSGVDAVLGPVDRAAGRVAGAAGGAVASLGDLADRSELQRLREENDRLRGDLAGGEADRRIAGEWRSLLSLLDDRDLTVVPARIVGAGSDLGFARTVTVDAGSRDGVEAGQAVLAGAGLVGRTVRVGPWTSVVLLLDDPQFGVGARLAGSGALGLASGAGPGRLRWVQVEPGAVEEGATLLTSGSDTFVADLPVGRVHASAPTPGGLTTVADIRPFADLTGIDVVGVVTAAPRTTPRAPLAPPS